MTMLPPTTDRADMTDLAANQQVLDARVSGVERGLADVKKDVATLSGIVTTSHEKLSQQIAGLSTNLATAGNTDWKTILGFVSAGVAVIAVFLTLQKAPIDEAIASNKANLFALQNAVVPRAEHEKEWQLVTNQFLDQRRDIDRLQKLFETLLNHPAKNDRS